MKLLKISIFSCVVFIATGSYAQRDQAPPQPTRVQQLKFDDGSGHFLIVQMPTNPSWNGTLDWSFPTPPGAGIPSGFVYTGNNNLPSEVLSWLPAGQTYVNKNGTTYQGGTGGAWVPKTPSELPAPQIATMLPPFPFYTLQPTDRQIYEGNNIFFFGLNLSLPAANTFAPGQYVDFSYLPGFNSGPIFIQCASSTDVLIAHLDGNYQSHYPPQNYANTSDNQMRFISDGSGTWYVSGTN